MLHLTLFESGIAVILFLAGVAALLVGAQLRNGPGLPPALSADDVAQAHRLLHRIGEHGRRLPGPAADGLVSALLFADAVVTLWWSAPALMPELTPLASALTALVVGLVLAKVMRVGVNALAIAIRRAQVQIRHGRLASSSSEADRADAAVMRACNRSAVQAWPMPPRAVWRARCWAGTTPWLLYLIVLFVALLSLRLFGATTLEDVIGCAVTGVVLLATLVYAVRESVAAEGLTEPIADMRRICARFESTRAFCEYMASEHRAVEIQLQQATFWCTNFFGETDFGDPRWSVDFVNAWLRRMHDDDARQLFAPGAARPAIQWENA